MNVINLSAIDIVSVNYIWVSMDTNYDVDQSGAINIGDNIGFTITVDDFPQGTDIATIDIGTLYQGIQLYNDGTHGDGGYDKVYTGSWIVPEGTSTFEAPVTGNYWDSGVKRSLLCSSTITFDAERPVVNNINIAPNSFNPYIESAEIAYSLSETVNNVTVNIYADLGKSALVKSLPKPPAQAGDNFISWWDGKQDNGTWYKDPPDDDYYIHISCKDLSGNFSESPMATVKISSIKMEIISLDITPTPVSPNGDDVNDRIFVNTKIIMYSWDGQNQRSISRSQMSNLEFTAGSNFSGNMDGTIMYFWPYAQCGFTIYDALGNEKKQIEHDLDTEVDGDIRFLNIFSALFPAPPNIPDDDKNNDWDTLVPLYDDGESGHEFDYGPGNGYNDGIYTAEHSFEIELLGSWLDGTYIVRVGSELTGIEYSIIDGGIHFEPLWKGGYINSKLAQSTFLVDNTGASGVDSVAPHVEAVYPEQDSQISYRLNLVSAFLQDDLTGSGIDLLQSDIYLKDSSGQTVAGQKINNGVDVITWQLDQPLAISGTYTICVLPVDKRGNQPAENIEYTFKLEVTDDDVNMITVNKGGTVIDNLGRVCLSVPPYAVDQDIRITLFEPFSFPGEYTTYGGYQFMPSKVSFKRPVTLTAYYSQSDKANLPAGVTETSLRLYTWKKDHWDYLGGNVDVNSMSVTVSGIRKIDGFYALIPETIGGLPQEVVADVQVDKPFKKNGYISFKLSGSIVSMKLLIYSLNGALIKDLPINLSAFNNAGYYDLNWDLVAGDSAIANNGIYIFRFIVERSDGKTKVISKAIPVIK